MRDTVTFSRAGYKLGSLNGCFGFVKLFPCGSIVIRPRVQLGWEAMSPRRSRVRAGVLVSLGVHKGKGLARFLANLEACARIPDSWVWRDDATGSLNSARGLRKVRKLHWKGGAHATTSQSKRVWIPSQH